MKPDLLNSIQLSITGLPSRANRMPARSLSARSLPARSLPDTCSPVSRVLVNCGLLLCWMLLSSVLAGCAPAQIKSTNPDVTAKQRPIVRPESNSASNAENPSATNSVKQNNTQSKPKPVNPATQALRAQAESALKQNDMPAATRFLERALRIDPRDAATYYTFAQLRIKQNQPDAAAQMIDKGLSLRPDTKLAAQLKSLREKTTSQ